MNVLKTTVLKCVTKIFISFHSVTKAIYNMYTYAYQCEVFFEHTDHTDMQHVPYDNFPVYIVFPSGMFFFQNGIGSF